MNSRKGERPRTHFRTERVQQSNGAWFLLTRESIQEGPFRTRQEVMALLERHSAVWNCNLFSNKEFDRINSLGLQTEIAHRSTRGAANGPYHAGSELKKTQQR